MALQMHSLPLHDAAAATEHSAGSAAEATVPIVEVAVKNGMWWALPVDISRQLYDQQMAGLDAGYTWDWGPHGRRGSWCPEGEDTTVNRYVVDFVAMVQTNIDNGRMRSVRIAWVRPADVQARYIGELPQHG